MPLLAGLRRNELVQLAKHVEDLDAPAGTDLYREGDLACEGFKSYNDTFGHAEGDLLLRRLSTRLADVTGGSAYRLGGDEFCALLPGSLADNEALADACIRSISEEGEGFAISASAGFVEFPREVAESTATLLLADQRMYAEKETRSGSAKQQTRDMVLRILAERHPDLHEHISAVASAARQVGMRLAMSREDLDDLVRAAELHDIGKIAIPDAILHKPGPLDEEEWQFMRRHTIVGESMLSAAPALAAAAKAVRCSHERFDGGGYPDGLRGEDIPLASRIIFICDSFHAMTSERAYQTARDTEGALAEMRRCAGTQFDPGLVEVFESAAAWEPAPGLAEPAHEPGNALLVPALAPGLLSA